MKILCLDLEYNNNLDEGNTPKSRVTDIIQIGAAVLETETGLILDTFDRLIKLRTPLDNGELRLSQFIETLTGIKNSDIEERGVDLLDAYEDLINFCKANGVSRIPATWGTGDIPDLRQQVEDHVRDLSKSVPFISEEEIDGFFRKHMFFSNDENYTLYNKKWSGWYFSKYEHTGVIDVKKFWQVRCFARNEKHSGGLRTIVNKLGLKLPSNMSYHNAVADAYMTGLVLHKLMENFK
jgi:inhibitor of KinA sporulation pathway (predicted exonuclease)